MPKRSHKNEDSDDYLRRKLRKIERKLAKRGKRWKSRSESSDSSAMFTPVQSEYEGRLRALRAFTNDIVNSF